MSDGAVTGLCLLCRLARCWADGDLSAGAALADLLMDIGGKYKRCGRRVGGRVRAGYLTPAFSRQARSAWHRHAMLLSVVPGLLLPDPE